MKNFLILFIFLVFVKNLYALNIDESIKSTIKNNSKVKIALEKINESKENVVFATGSINYPKLQVLCQEHTTNSETTTTTTSSTPETIY